MSLRFHAPVADVLWSYLSNTLLLGAVCFAFIVPLSMLLGITAGLREGSGTYRVISITSSLLASVPEFALAVFLAFPFVFLGRVPRQVQAPIAAAREAARAAGAMHPAFPALVQESPRATLAMLRHCDAVAGVTVTVAADALRLGEVVALPWRAPWVSVHPGVVRLRGRPLGEAEQGFLDLLRDADAEAERDAIAWCAAAGLSPDCGGAEPYPPTKPDAAMARSSGAASKPKSA
jgi:hypothetical protein